MRARQRLKNTNCNCEYNITQKNYKCYCVLCNRNSGIFNAYCGAYNIKRKKNWKSYRKFQWKEKKTCMD